MAMKKCWWEVIEDGKVKGEFLEQGAITDFVFWGEIIDRCDRVAERLGLEFIEFSDVRISHWGWNRYERYYAYFKKRNSDNEIRAVVLEIVTDSKVREFVEIRVASEEYIEEQLKEELKEQEI
jgi:hypothetical protein